MNSCQNGFDTTCFDTTCFDTTCFDTTCFDKAYTSIKELYN